MPGVSFSEKNYKNCHSDTIIFSDTSIRYLIIPLANLNNNSRQSIIDEFEKDFYIKSFNQLLLIEMEKNSIAFVVDSLHEFDKIRKDYNEQNNDSMVHSLLKKNSCDRIFTISACSLQQVEMQHKGWRNSRFGASYERPVQTAIYARLEIEVLSSNGIVMTKQIIEGKSKKPFMYALLKRTSKNSTIRNYARSLYGPPGLKALYNAITSLFMD